MSRAPENSTIGPVISCNHPVEALVDWVLAYEPELRLAVFAGIFALMAFWEFLAERRELQSARPGRWWANLALSASGSLVVRLLFPTAAMGFALFAEHRDSGLLQHMPLPLGVAVVVSIVLLDLAIYAQHVVFHAVPWLWRLHMVHHSDTDVDVTTGIRFHPFEILLSLAWKAFVILLLGPPLVAVVLFEVLLNATSMFNHGNVRLPHGLDRLLRWILVTPDMHRIHHSIEADESNSNFGFNLSWWDRIFRTYRVLPRGGHADMTLGVAHLQQEEAKGILRLLALPFAPTEKAYEELALDDIAPD